MKYYVQFLEVKQVFDTERMRFTDKVYIDEVLGRDGVFILDGRNNLDTMTQDAIDRAKRLARENGLLVGVSAAANVLAAEQWIENNEFDGVVVTFLCDRGERYLSVFNA